MGVETSAALAALGVVAVTGVALPWCAVRALLAAGTGADRAVANYRGRPVAPVLGVVWPLWAVSLLGTQAVLEAIGRLVPGGSPLALVVTRLVDTPLALPLYAVPFLLAVGVYALGAFDDAFGAGGPKGFRGHLSALRSGRLTTGMVKMLGIGVLAVFYGATAAGRVLERSGALPTWLAEGPAGYLSAWALSALVIALAANLGNLLDLRPGRALKVYGIAVVVPAAAFALRAIGAYHDSVAMFAGEVGGLALVPAEQAAVVAGVILAALGPVVAVWNADLGERAMLGDGGANVMGAIVGYLLTAVLGLAGLAVAAVLLLALNLASERVSFSAVFERVALLAWFDRFGRGDRHAPTPPGAETAGRGPDDGTDAPSGAAERRPVRYDASGTASEGED